jgi:hypothetical protein
MAMKVKLLGRDDDLLLAIGAAVLGVGAVVYIATAVTAEAQRRWEKVASGAKEVIALSAAGGGAIGMISGLPVGRKKARENGKEEGFNEGFWTPNPAITTDDRLSATEMGRAARGGGSAVATAIGSGVAAGVSGVVANSIMDRFAPGPSTETLRAPAPPPPEPLPSRKLLERMTVAQLRSLAREEGKGGDGLSGASKKEIIERLLGD